jgi:hypothetical protein
VHGGRLEAAASSGAKALSLLALCGTAEAVPYPKAIYQIVCSPTIFFFYFLLRRGGRGFLPAGFFLGAFAATRLYDWRIKDSSWLAGSRLEFDIWIKCRRARAGSGLHQKAKAKANARARGRGCPALDKGKSKGKSKIKGKSKGRGQECPRYKGPKTTRSLKPHEN